MKEELVEFVELEKQEKKLREQAKKLREQADKDLQNALKKLELKSWPGIKSWLEYLLLFHFRLY